MAWKHGRSKPVIGVIGGIGSGKSSVARLFGKEGCAVIDSDALSHEILQTASVREELQDWLGAPVIDVDGRVDRRAVARAVFGDKEKLDRLNRIIHPRVAQKREDLIRLFLADKTIRAIVWDSPLLVETGLDRECDAIILVKVPRELRLERVKIARGWTEEEVERRENLQFSLDKKAQIADYCIDNSGDEVASLYQVQRVLSHLLAKSDQVSGINPC